MQNTRIRNRHLAYRFITILIGLVFLAAGILKGIDLNRFAIQIRQYGILPEIPDLVMGTAWFMATFEMLLGMALVVNWRPRVTLLGAISLLSIFIVALTLAMLNGGVDDCGCFGPSIRRSPFQAMIDDLLLLAGTLAAWHLRGDDIHYRRQIKSWCVALACAVGILLPIAMDGLQSILPSGLPDANAGMERIQLHAKDGDSLDLEMGTCLVVLMSTDCHHCQESVPMLNEIVADVGEKIRVFGVSADGRSEIEQFIEDNFAFYPIVSVDESDLDRLLGDDPFPKCLLVHEGKIVANWNDKIPSSRELVELAGVVGRGA